MPNYPADEIFISPDLVKEIADSGHTPFYLYHAEGIQHSVDTLHQLFQWSHGYQNYFALRENINPHLLRLLAAKGTGVCVTSMAELELACRCGFSGNGILYEPSAADPEAEALAKETGAVWLFDSAATIPDDLPEQILLRYHLCDLPLSPKIRQIVARNKNGFNRQQIFEMVDRFLEKGVARVGLALNVSSYSIEPGFWKRKAVHLMKLAAEIVAKTGMEVWGIHIGEGPGLPYQPRTPAPSMQEEAAALQAAYEKAASDDCRPVVLTGVTGRIMEQHGLLITKVLEKRYISKTFLVLDAGISQYNRPILKQAYRHVSVLGRSEIENRQYYSIVGSLPDSFDRLVAKGRVLPKATPDDYCVIHDVGCGGRSMTLLYGLRPVAPEFLYEGGKIRQISPKRTPAEVLDFLTAW